MLCDDMDRLVVELNSLAGDVPEKTWRRLDTIRIDLRTLSEQVRQLENHFVPGKREVTTHERVSGLEDDFIFSAESPVGLQEQEVH